MNLGAIVLCAALLHVYLNWAHITRYIKSHAKQALKPSWELAFALALTIVVIIGTSYEAPPMSWTTDLHKAFQSRVAARDGVPPLGYAELTPLGILADQLDFDLETALRQLSSAGYPAEGPQTTILQIALANRVTPQAVYQAMMGGEEENIAPDQP
jgi:hypothetical protein